MGGSGGRCRYRERMADRRSRRLIVLWYRMCGHLYPSEIRVRDIVKWPSAGVHVSEERRIIYHARSGVDHDSIGGILTGSHWHIVHRRGRPEIRITAHNLLHLLEMLHVVPLTVHL